jgi:hypothetical protein
MEKRTAEINFHLTISTRGALQNVSTQAWFTSGVTPTLKIYANF